MTNLAQIKFAFGYYYDYENSTPFDEPSSLEVLSNDPLLHFTRLMMTGFSLIQIPVNYQY